MKTTMDILFSVAIHACISDKNSFVHAKEAPAMDEPSGVNHFYHLKGLRQVPWSDMVQFFVLTVPFPHISF